MKDILQIILSSIKPDYRELRSVFFRALVVLFALCVSSAVALIGLGFVVWSLYLYLATMLSPYWAALISGAGAVVLALVVVVAVLYLTGYFGGRRKAASKPRDAQPAAAYDPVDLVQRYPLESGLTAAIAGFIVGSSPDSPRTLTQFLTLLKESDPK
ncbi:MAG: hypothetical protein F9K51_00745 [Candidatus Dadabacteria bacterium]|nr:MAG: hypothetical protein F9K51_00745 [Candidatus Dadabacteria bacterium]